jgi:O-antigen/teichoic acid export membrane protein
MSAFIAATTWYWNSKEQARKQLPQLFRQSPSRTGREAWLYGRAPQNDVIRRVISSSSTDASFESAAFSFIDELATSSDGHDASFDGSDAPSVDVVVCSTYRRLPELERCIRSILANDYPFFSVIVVRNGMSSGELPMEITSHKQVRFVHQPIIGLSKARNEGLSASRAPYVVFTDDDVIVEADWISEIVSAFSAQPDASSVTGLVIPAEIETPTQLRFERLFDDPASVRRLHCPRPKALIRQIEMQATGEARGPALKLPPHVAAGHAGLGANMAFKRADLVGTKVFDENLGGGTPTAGGEEIRLFAELLVGGKVVSFTPTAVVRHFHLRTPKDFELRIPGIGRSVSATILALTLSDPRYALEWLASKVPTTPALKKLGIARFDRLPSVVEAFQDRESRRLYRAGLVRGPVAYLQAAYSASRDRRFTRAFLSSPIVRNAASLYGTTVVTSVLGFFYWLVAAKLVSARAVGTASAVQSAAGFLSIVCVLGLSTLLISELSRDSSNARSLMLTAAISVGLISVVVAVVLTLVIERFSPSFRHGLGGVVPLVVFALLSALTSIALVLDDACIGLLRGELQLRRNSIFAAGKLLLLPILAVIWHPNTGIELVVAWLAGLGFSLVVITHELGRQTIGQSSSTSFRRFVEKRRLVVGHHSLNLAILAPRLILPVIVATLVGPQANAGFTVSILVVGFVTIIPTHLSTVLFALVPGDEVALHLEIRKTMRFCLLLALASAPFFVLFSRIILGIFGHSYLTAAPCLAILGFTIYPLAIKSHYVAIARVRGKMQRAAVLALVGACLEVGLAAGGAVEHGETGVGIGLLAATIFEGLFFAPSVFGVVRGRGTPQMATSHSAGDDLTITTANRRPQGTVPSYGSDKQPLV